MKSSRIILTGAMMRVALAGLLVMAAGIASAGAAEKAVQAGTGYSIQKDAQKAGAEAAKKAKAALGKQEAKVVLVFGLDKVDHAKMLEGVNSVFTPSIVYGCSAYNAITQEGNDGSAGVLALAGKVTVTAAIADVEGKDFEGCGKKIGQALKKPAQAKGAGRMLIVIGDCHVPFDDKVVKGICGVLGRKFPIVGAAAAGGIVYSKGKVVGKAKNIGILITGDFTIGCSTLKEGPPDVHKNKVVAAAGQAFKNAVGKDMDKVVLMFAFDCGGRRGQMGKDRPEELKVMQAVVGKKMPIIGFYGSGEIGPKDNDSPSRGVGWHISACALKTK